ncbi:MAG TPA: hypothetical protein PLC05_03175 [bacterium]|nr:hypothetical protein [bacterium]
MSDNKDNKKDDKDKEGKDYILKAETGDFSVSATTTAIAKIIGIDDKPADPTLEITKNPKMLAELELDLFSNTGFRDGDYKGDTTERGIKEAFFQNKRGQGALIPHAQIPTLLKKQKGGQGALIPPPPDATANQLKNLHALTILLDKQNKIRVKRGEPKTTTIEFELKDYEKIRGKTDIELARGGKFRDLLKYTLISGGATTFITEDDKYYKIRHHHFYNLDIPKTPNGKWTAYIQEPYAQTLLNFNQYIPIVIRALQDRQTDQKKGYLYFFFYIVLFYSNNPETGFTSEHKVSNLLNKIKVSDEILNKPKRAFRVLAECISYVADNYKDILKEVRLLNAKYEVKVIRDLTVFKNTDYEQFNALYLKPLGLKDIRDALISFNPIRIKELAQPEHKDHTEGEFIEIKPDHTP